MMKSVLAASAILVALCAAAAARDVVHHPYANSEGAVQLSQVHPASMDYSAMAEDVGYDAHQYHGGPKVND
ncbi:hypothetical protein A5906_35825 [Bradyrhizobium sacchari]|uniref:Uncharacterized protein n=1 Tax=Bradyrhizobium sacchari TaxID=1399419 RepID=A0A560JLV1_9BRAD|nr:hypothetical protein [Bradyrhizobium sacchari]OPY97640.1 hypothetical protein A5906_35825 [Bradyrhizobium sacchari]TWB57282.1 hypothetical protein FBZ94_106542 [Bradyrhizobium sacchari]TWB71559.1 hypothetical protein FBZ95_107542 [Bradyrhizobium sacchari]